MVLRLARALAVALALLVPIHGMAAVTTGLCMALAHHDHQDAHDGAAHSHPDHTDSTAAGMHNDEGNAAHCGPCTACCASPSISTAAPSSILPGASHAPYILSQLAPPSIQLDGLDRPPLAL